MFERFTDQARRAVVLASESARAHNHEYLGTDDLLLGLLREEGGVAAKSLKTMGISAEVIDSRLTGTGKGEGTRSGHIPFSPQAKKVLEQSMRETSLLGHDQIGTEHLLLALIDNRVSTGARLLGDERRDRRLPGGRRSIGHRARRPRLARPQQRTRGPGQGPPALLSLPNDEVREVLVRAVKRLIPQR